MDDHNCHVEPLEKAIDHDALKEAHAAYLAIWGMGCERCAMRVCNSLLALDGVLRAEVNLHQSVAVVAFASEQTTVDDLVQAVAGAGSDGRHHYEAQVLRQLPAALMLR